MLTSTDFQLFIADESANKQYATGEEAVVSAYANGQKKQTIQKTDDGTILRRYAENGDLITEAPRNQQSMTHGMWKQYSDKKLLATLLYENGKPIGALTSYNRNGMPFIRPHVS